MDVVLFFPEGFFGFKAIKCRVGLLEERFMARICVVDLKRVVELWVAPTQSVLPKGLRKATKVYKSEVFEKTTTKKKIGDLFGGMVWHFFWKTTFF